MRPNKPENMMIVNSPLINGRTDAIHSKSDSPMGSPLLIPGSNQKRESKNISDIHKKVLLKNLGLKPGSKGDENLEVSEEGSPIDTNIKNMKKDDKPVKPSKESPNTINSSYIASPLGKKPRGSVDNKRPGGTSPLKQTNEVKSALQKFEDKKY